MLQTMQETVNEGVVSNKSIRRFIIPNLNLRAKVYHQLVNLNDPDIGQPPAVQHMSDAELESLITHPLALNHPCHNQGVERHVKLVTEASMSVAGHEKRDGLIRQRVCSRKMMKCFESKHQYPL